MSIIFTDKTQRHHKLNVNIDIPMTCNRWNIYCYNIKSLTEPESETYCITCVGNLGGMDIFVKLEELHIVTARKPRIHQNQPVAQYLHKIQPCMF